MPDRTYDGPYPAVDLILAGGAVTVKRGETVPVSDDEAKSLDEQGGWLKPSSAQAEAPVEPLNTTDSPAEAPAPASSS